MWNGTEGDGSFWNTNCFFLDGWISIKMYINDAFHGVWIVNGDLHLNGDVHLTSLNYRCSELAVPTTCCSAIKLQSCELKLPTFVFSTSVRNTTPAATCISHQNSLSIFPMYISINRTCLKSSSVHRTTKVYHDFYAGALLEHGGPLQHRASLMKRLSEFVRRTQVEWGLGDSWWGLPFANIWVSQFSELNFRQWLYFFWILFYLVDDLRCPKFNSLLPEKLPKPNRTTIVFQPAFFRCFSY